MTFGSLFSGIGGMDLGLERAGMQCVWQCEIDPFCQQVLARHWPTVPRWDDVTTFDPRRFERPDLIAGGFPCQDISVSGKRAGIDGERSGLWREFARIIRLVRPACVLVENVPGILVPRSGQPAAMARVLGDLAQSGYDAEWTSLPAWAFGSTQARWRVFIVAYPNRKGLARWKVFGGNLVKGREAIERVCGKTDPNTGSSVSGQGAEEGGNESREWRTPSESGRCNSPFIGSGWWGTEPSLARMVYGISRRMVRDAVRGLGNAVIPQVAEWIGRQIVNHAKKGDQQA